jgi:anti-sigma factor RsiW
MKPNEPTSACPSPELLGDFLLGRLPGAEVQRIGAHLANCVECSTRAAATVDDRLIADLRRSLRAPTTKEEHDSEHAAARAESICASLGSEADAPMEWPPPPPPPKPSLWTRLKRRLGL